MQKHIRQRISLRNPQHFLALGFGTGLSPVMPGTVGTLAGVPFTLLAVVLPWYGYLLAICLAIIIGIKVCQTTSDAMQVHDHGSIVWDEVAGIMITFMLVPINWMMLILGFILFRALDIIKPWPISLLDKKVGGGVGIMLDDILAGIIACGLLHLLVRFIPQLT